MEGQRGSPAWSPCQAELSMKGAWKRRAPDREGHGRGMQAPMEVLGTLSWEEAKGTSGVGERLEGGRGHPGQGMQGANTPPPSTVPLPASPQVAWNLNTPLFKPLRVTGWTATLGCSSTYFGERGRLADMPLDPPASPDTAEVKTQDPLTWGEQSELPRWQKPNRNSAGQVQMLPH